MIFLTERSGKGQRGKLTRVALEAFAGRGWINPPAWAALAEICPIPRARTYLEDLRRRGLVHRKIPGGVLLYLQKPPGPRRAYGERDRYGAALVCRCWTPAVVGQTWGPPAGGRAGRNRCAGLEPSLTALRGRARSGGFHREVRVAIFFPRHDRGERIAPHAGRVAVRGVGFDDRADCALKLVKELVEISDRLRRRDLAVLNRSLDHAE